MEMDDKLRRTELAHFLKARRLHISPGESGLEVSNGLKRRKPGLRREEVAALSGISLPWYTALEQARDIRVSAQVLESLVRTFKLRKDERLHLYMLANQQTPMIPISDSKRSFPRSFQYIVDQYVGSPAFFSDQMWNIRIWNQITTLVFGDFHNTDNFATNMIWRIFTMKEYRLLFVNWEHMAKNLLTQFRTSYIRNMENPWYNQFIKELAKHSTEFQKWWADYDLQYTQEEIIEITHPKVGLLQFEIHEFYQCEDLGTALIIYIPLPETDSTEKLLNLTNS